MVHKEDMDGRNTQGRQNERWLWHGTSSTSTNSINTHGFNRSYCGQNGQLFGAKNVEAIIPQGGISIS